MADQISIIPKGWKMTTLGGVISSGLVSNYNNKRYPLAGGERLKRQGIYPYYGAASAIDYINDYKYDGFYLLVAEDGTVYDGKSPMLQLVNGKFWVSNHSHVLQGKDENTTRFLSYILKNVSISPYITGAVQPKLTKENLYSISFLIPENEMEQCAIALVLSSLDDKIELLREQNKSLEATAQAIFKEWFVNFNFPGATGKMIDSELGEIPDGWRVYELRDLFAFVKGKKPNSTSETFVSGFLPQILIDTLDGGKVIFADSKNTVLSREEDLVMVMDGASSGRIEFGYSGIIGSTLSVLDFKKECRAILYFFLKNKEGEIKGSTTGSAIPHTDKEKIYQYSIALPLKDLEKLENILNSFRKKVILNRKSIQTLSTIRDTFLPKLIRGEVRVKGF